MKNSVLSLKLGALLLLALALGWVVMQATPMERREKRGPRPTQD